MPAIQVGAAISASFGYIGVAWRRAAAILLIAMALVGALQVLNLVEPGLLPLRLLGGVVGLVINTIVIGALFRIGLEPAHPGDPDYRAHPGGVQWGALEWRVLGANLLFGIGLVVVVLLVALIWGIAVGVAASGDAAALQGMRSGDQGQTLQAFAGLMLGPAGVISAVILLPTLAAVVYVSARTSLYNLSAADTRSFDLGSAWALTRGALWTIIVTGFVILVVQVLLGAVCGFVAGVLAGAAGHPGAGSAWGGVAGQTIDMAISAPLFVGLQLYVYNIRRGGDAIAATFS